MTPVLVILVAMVAGLALVAVCIILVMRGEDTQVNSEEKHDHKCFKKFHPKVRNHGEGPY